MASEDKWMFYIGYAVLVVLAIVIAYFLLKGG
jgi:hypothetical protein